MVFELRMVKKVAAHATLFVFFFFLLPLIAEQTAEGANMLMLNNKYLLTFIKLHICVVLIDLLVFAIL